MTVFPPLFDGLDDDAQTIIRGMLQRVPFHPRQQLFAQGDAADAAFFIQRGEVDIDVRLPGGRVSRLTTVGPGRVLGELSLVADHHRRTATATAANEVDCLIMERRDLLALCAQLHPAARAVLSNLGDHVMAAIARVNRERILLGHAPRASTGEVRPARVGADFEVLDYLGALSFAQELSRTDCAELLDSGQLYTLPACGTPPQTPERTWVLILRGAVSVCTERGGDTRRLSLVGPGDFAVSDGFVGSGRIGSREGATVLVLSEDTIASWAQDNRRWTHRALQAWVRATMDRLAADTRALTRERRLAGANPGGPAPAEVIDA